MDFQVLFELLVRLSYVVIFLVVLGVAVRRPHRSNIHIVLFFGALTVAMSLGWTTEVLGMEPAPWLQGLLRILVVTLPYLLLRVVSEFSSVPRGLLPTAAAGLVLSAVAILIWADLPAPVLVVIVGYFILFQVYSAIKFVRESRHVHGVTRRRMRAAAIGTILLSAAILIAAVAFAQGAPDDSIDLLIEMTLLAAGFTYLVGFAPPVFLRRAWQEPELRAFLHRVAELPWLEDTASIVRRIEDGAATSFGAERATIALWDPEIRALRMPSFEPAPGNDKLDPGEFIAGQAFREGRAIFSSDVRRTDPANAEAYERWNVRAILSAPIVAGEERIGVLSVWGHRTPVFVADDLGLVQLLADQAAIVLKSRDLLEAAAEVQARKRAMRLKDDFLSAAAHNLRTPLTSIIGSAQLLERKAAARTGNDSELAGLQRLSREATRLAELVAHLLDVAQAEDEPLVKQQREALDLTELVHEVCARQSTELHPCDVQAQPGVIADVDRVRIEELIEGLIDNGRKFTPDGGAITVRVWREPGSDGDRARLSVRDHGIGIPAEDRLLVFERFQRGANVDDRRFSGMGLGLYLCRVIAEQHGGRVWLESRVGEGSTFHVELPVAVQPTRGEVET